MHRKMMEKHCFKLKQNRWIRAAHSLLGAVALLGEQHLRHLPMVYLDQRTTYQLSFDETSDKSEVYIVNRRCFAIAGGCALIFREGQDDIYGISQQWLLRDANLTDISINDFPANHFSTDGRFSRVSFLDDMFFKYCQRESICAAFQQSLRSSKGIKKIMFTVGNIRPDTWEDILSYLDGVEIKLKNVIVIDCLNDCIQRLQ